MARAILHQALATSKAFVQLTSCSSDLAPSHSKPYWLFTYVKAATQLLSQDPSVQTATTSVHSLKVQRHLDLSSIHIRIPASTVIGNRRRDHQRLILGNAEVAFGFKECLAEVQASTGLG